MRAPWPVAVAGVTLALWALHVLLTYGRVGLSGAVPLGLLWPRVGSTTIACLGFCVPLCLVLKRVHATCSTIVLALTIPVIAIAGGIFGGAAIAAYASITEDIHPYSVGYQFGAASIYWMWIYLGWSLAVVIVLRDSPPPPIGHALPEATQRPVEFWVRRNHHRERVRCAEVLWFEAAGDYVMLHTADRAHMVHQSLTALAKVLDSREFSRVHRSAIVNLKAITGVRRKPNGDYLLDLCDGSFVRVGRTYKTALRSTIRFMSELSGDCFEQFGEKPLALS